MIDTYQKTAQQKGKCEDYVTHNDKVIVLSDGCSSSKDTHLGSMLYCEKGLDYFSKYIDEIIIKQDWRTLALMSKDIFGKRNNSYSYLDATCLVLKEKDNSVSISICGDGLLFYKYKDTEPYFQEFYFEGNSPMYPSYLLETKRLESFENLEQNDYKYNTTIGSGSVSFPVGGAAFPTRYLEKKDLEYVGIASDGVFDFQQNGNPIDIKIIFDHITAFKGSGEFMKRKMRHMFKTLAKEGIFPHDDFSIGVWKNATI